MSTHPSHSAAHDFDFLVGTWHTQQRRLKKRLQGNDEWETFAATITMQKLPGGVGNFDTMVAEEWRPGWVGMTTRIYNAATRLWSIYWYTNDGGGIDAASGQFDPPVVGGFEGDVGIFECDDRLDGRPIRVQYRWERLGPDAARWQQAFSPDGGRTWEINWVGEFKRAEPLPAPAAATETSPVLELRQYTLHPGRRTALVDLFDREFVETQEAVGLRVLGQFRDLDRPDRWVWLRGFADMASRPAALSAFYDGPVWKAHREAANATMIDASNVLLLQPAWPGADARMAARRRAPAAPRDALPGLLDVRIVPLREAAPAQMLALGRTALPPLFERHGGEMIGCHVTEPTPNNYPRLPLREGETVFVVFTLFSTAAAHEKFVERDVWAREAQPLFEPWCAPAAGGTEALRLVPTARSAIHA